MKWARRIGAALRARWARVLEGMQPVVFFGSAAMVVIFVGVGALQGEQATSVFEAAQRAIVDRAGWFYVITASALLAFTLWIGLGRHGSVRLGGDDARPEFSTPTWLAMLLSAGMGIGIVFFGAAEPIEHFDAPPAGFPGDGAADVRALQITFHHWGLHAWGIYSTFALSLAYFHFRLGLPLAPRSMLHPLLGERIHGGIGHAVDILCTVGTLFGVATSLGLGASQINAGLHALFDVPQALRVQLALIAGITAVATVSVVTGLHRGIQALSRTNIALAALLLAFVLLAGPTVYALELFASGLGAYLQALPAASLWTAPGDAGDWQARWTLFYWSWWMSWSPFVGVFVARISRGRTLRQFALGALCLPPLASFLWFATVGGTAIHAIEAGAAGLLDRILADEALSFFAVLDTLPLAGATQVAATALVLIFFVTSSDSGSLVDDMVTSGGHPDPPRAQRVFWACAEGAVAATLLVAGGLVALRTASLVTGLPLAVLLWVAAVGLVRALNVDAAREGIPERDEVAPDSRGGGG